MKLPPKELVVASRLEKYPPPPVNDHASLKRWRSFSPFWWGVVQGLIEALSQKILWIDLTDEIRQQIEVLALPEVPDCEDCEQEKPIVIIQAGGGSQVGALGLTIEELEEMIMGCIDISNSIKYDTALKTLLVWSCHDGWVPITGITGTIPTSGALGAAAQSVDEWIEAGSPEIAPVTGIVHDNPFYTTMDSLKCAKATAIVEEIWNVIEGFRVIAGEWADDILTIAGISTALTAIFPIAAPTFAIAAGIVGLLIKFLTPDLETRLLAVENDVNGKQELICALVDKMIAPTKVGPFLTNKMTATDVQIALDTFEEMIEHHSDVRKVLGLFPISSWIEVVAPKVKDTECGCGEYLPAQYIPPPSAGFSLDFNRFAKAHGATITTDYSPNPTNDFEATLSPPMGTRVGQDYRAQYTGSANGFQYTALGVVFQADEPIDVSNIKVNWTNTINVDLKFKALGWNGAAWVTIHPGTNEVNVAAGTHQTVLMPGSNVEDIQYIHIVTWVKGYPVNSGNVPYVVIDSVLFSGVIVSSAVGFVDLEDNVGLV